MSAEEVHHQFPFLVAGRGTEHVVLAVEEACLGRVAGLRHASGQTPGHVGAPRLVLRTLGDEHGIRDRPGAERCSRPGPLVVAAPGPGRPLRVAGPGLAGLEIGHDEGGPGGVRRGVDGNGVGHFGSWTDT